MSEQIINSDEYLSDLEVQKILSFVTDKDLMEAVKKVLLAGVYYNGSLRKNIKPDATKNFALGLAFDPKITNEELGSDLRAAAQGISFIEQGFKELVKIANSPIKSMTSEEVNPAE